MNIAVIAADLDPDNLGGAEQHLVEIIKRLGHKHKFIIFVGKDTKIKKNLLKKSEVFSINYPKIPNFFGLAFIFWGVFKAKRVLDKKNFDFIWAKQVFPQAILGVILAKVYKKPLYITAQNPLAFKEELVIKGTIPFKKQIPNLLTPLVKYALKNANLVAAVSKYSENQAKKLGAKETLIIPNGVNLKRFKLIERKTKNKTIIITTSSLIPRNGVDLLIKAVSLLPADLEWELVIAGEGPEFNNLKFQISNLKLERKIKMIGRVENKNIPNLLAKADVFVRLSRWEGFGVSFLEAMAAGIPVIATPVGGIVDFIKNRQTGMLVDPNHPRKAAQAIAELVDNKSLYTKLQKNGKQLVKDRYNWEKIANEVDKAFQTIS